jgi:hypothetical protein
LREFEEIEISRHKAVNSKEKNSKDFYLISSKNSASGQSATSPFSKWRLQAREIFSL